MESKFSECKKNCLYKTIANSSVYQKAEDIQSPNLHLYLKDRDRIFYEYHVFVISLISSKPILSVA